MQSPLRTFDLKLGRLPGARRLWRNRSLHSLDSVTTALAINDSPMFAPLVEHKAANGFSMADVLTGRFPPDGHLSALRPFSGRVGGPTSTATACERARSGTMGTGARSRRQLVARPDGLRGGLGDAGPDIGV